MLDGAAIDTGFVEEIFSFVDGFPNSAVSNVLSASALIDKCGGIGKPALFEHPTSKGDAVIEYEVQIPEPTSEEVFVLLFDIGIRDGIKTDDPNAPFDGVKFAIEIDKERVFQDEAHQCRWEPHLVDLTDYIGKTVRVRFITNCRDNSNYDWALWGNPRIVSLTPSESVDFFSSGLLLYQLEDGKLEYIEFDYSGAMTAKQIAEETVSGIEVEGRIQQMFICSYLPEPVLVGLGLSKAVVSPSDHFEIRCLVENRGRAPIEPRHKLTVNLNNPELRRNSKRRAIDRLAPGESVLLRWQSRGNTKTSFSSISVSLSANINGRNITEHMSEPVELEPTLTGPSSKPPGEIRTYTHSNYVALENPYARIVFMNKAGQTRYAEVYAANDQNFYHVANLKPITRIVYLSDSGEPQDVMPKSEDYEIGGTADSGVVTLLTRFEDVDGVNWLITSDFTVDQDSGLIDVVCTLKTDRDRKLLHFSGPSVFAGDSSFGARKSFALFPGLEYLEGDESSSSTRDADPPLNMRLVPNPMKVTIPMMAVEENGYVVGLLWDQRQRWDGTHRFLSGQFASPNWYHNQDNHLMSLFVPTPPDWIEENQTVARKPYEISAGSELKLNFKLLVQSDSGVLDAVQKWIEVFGLPEPAPQPRTDEQEVLLCRHALMKTVWDEERQMARHCFGWASGNTPGFATLLWLDYLATRDESVKERVDLIAQKTIREEGPQGLISGRNCHILRWEFPFYYGHLREAIPAMRREVESIIEKQKSDGSWRFEPRTERTKELGQEGDTTVGICATNALPVLRFARITGDEKATEAGLKALKFMNGFAVPRGAQGWECPIYEPDILAAAYAVGAYVEGYRLTGDRNLLQKAEYWAKTGIPFIYLWALEDRPAMLYGTIPVFGTTFYNHPWFGVPVQWNGLVYAYYLQKLARFSDSIPWLQIAEGITVSAMYQQWEDGELKGTYPDGLYEECTQGRGPHINPENILVNLYALRGVDPDISTEILKFRGQRLHISSSAHIEDVRPIGGGIRIRLSLAADADSYLAAMKTDKPTVIYLGDTIIPEVSQIEDTTQGWTYDESEKAIYMKVHHREVQVEFDIKWVRRVGLEPPESLHRSTINLMKGGVAASDAVRCRPISLIGMGKKRGGKRKRIRPLSTKLAPRLRRRK